MKGKAKVASQAMDTEHAREFWRVAQTFPPEKEHVYPAHAKAHGFDLQAAKKVLEYGCGGGSDTISLLRRGADVFFVDIVPGNVEVTRQRVDAFLKARSKEGQTPSALGLVLEQSDKIPLNDGLFDTITCHGVLHHIEENLMHSVIDEMFRVLKPGGHLYAMLYTEFLFDRCKSGIDTVTKQQGWPVDRAFGYFTDGGGDKRWCIARSYTEAEGLALFQLHGFEFAEAVEYNDRDFRTFFCSKPR